LDGRTEVLVRRGRLGIRDAIASASLIVAESALVNGILPMEAPAWPKWPRGFNVYAINPKQLDRFRGRFSPAGAKDGSRDADALRTDMRAFRKLALAVPEWSRMTDDLNAECNRLCNRLREQVIFSSCSNSSRIWAPNGSLICGSSCRSPDKAMRIRETSIARVLKSRRIRCLTAADALTVLKKAVHALRGNPPTLLA
jgi:hypothetical protein